MKEKSHEVIDQFEEEPVKRWYSHPIVVFGPLILFGLGIVFKIQHWPYGSLIVGLALLLILVRGSILFLTRKRKIVEWLYFIARAFLIVVLSWQFIFQGAGVKLILIALSIFGLGVILILFAQKAKEEPQENQDDDY